MSNRNVYISSIVGCAVGKIVTWSGLSELEFGLPKGENSHQFPLH